jgi:DNA-binding transcriptional LysR family regulator
MIDNLKAFAAVIDSKSLTKASSRLHLTQSAISRRIQQLEEVLGGPAAGPDPETAERQRARPARL